jgi:hypothetical protein
MTRKIADSWKVVQSVIRHTNATAQPTIAQLKCGAPPLINLILQSPSSLESGAVASGSIGARRLTANAGSTTSTRINSDVMASLEWVVRDDRHGFSALPDGGLELRNATGNGRQVRELAPVYRCEYSSKPERRRPAGMRPRDRIYGNLI